MRTNILTLLVVPALAVTVLHGATSNAESATYVSAGLYPMETKSRSVYSPTTKRYVTEYYPVYQNRSLHLGVNGKDYLTINTNGSVSVVNTLYAQEIRVQANPFPDYVFADDYQLMPLLEVEAAIKRDRHLPGMPSAAAIHTDGMPVSFIVVKQMEKIEELTLHAIALKKENDTLKAELARTIERIAAMETRLDAQDGH